MVNIKTFQFSDNIIWGFKVTIDMDSCDTNLDIINKSKNQVLSFLDKYNLQLIKEKFNVTNYHIHKKFGDLFLNDDIDYICTMHDLSQ